MNYLTSIPRLFAVPIRDFLTESLFLVFITGSFTSMMSSRSAFEIVATLFELGSPDHFWILALYLIRSELIGGLSSILYDLSMKTVMSTGILIVAPPYCCIVSCDLSLNSFTNAQILIPCCPRIGPIGGAGVAFHAGIWSVNCSWILPAMRICSKGINVVLASNVRTSPNYSSTSRQWRNV